MKEILPLLAGLGVTFFTQNGLWGMFAFFLGLIIVFWSDNPGAGFWSAVGGTILGTLLSTLIFSVALGVMFLTGMFKQDWQTELADGDIGHFAYGVAGVLVYGALHVFRKVWQEI